MHNFPHPDFEYNEDHLNLNVHSIFNCKQFDFFLDCLLFLLFLFFLLFSFFFRILLVLLGEYTVLLAKRVVAIGYSR